MPTDGCELEDRLKNSSLFHQMVSCVGGRGRFD